MYIFDRDSKSGEVVSLISRYRLAAPVVSKFELWFVCVYVEKTDNPEVKPPSFFPHGLAKDDWVTVWFFG